MIKENAIYYDLNLMKFRRSDNETIINENELPLCYLYVDNRLLIIGNGSIEQTFGKQTEAGVYPVYPWLAGNGTEVTIIGKGVKYINDRFAGFSVVSPWSGDAITAEIKCFSFAEADRAIRTFAKPGQAKVKLNVGVTDPEKSKFFEPNEIKNIDKILMWSGVLLNDSYLAWLIIHSNIPERGDLEGFAVLAMLVLIFFFFIGGFVSGYSVARCIYRIYGVPVKEDFFKNYYVPEVSKEKRSAQLKIFTIWSVVINAAWFVPSFLTILFGNFSLVGVTLVSVLPAFIGFGIYLVGWHLIRLKMLRSF